MLTALGLIGGLALLTIGAEALVRSASALAAAARISPLVIGLTVVAFGTSAPELVVSVQSSIRGQTDIALGNVVGSNIFNVLFILGLSALIVPLQVSRQLVRFDVPLMIGLSLLVTAMAADGVLGLWDGGLLTAGLILYTVWGIRLSRKEQRLGEASATGPEGEFAAASQFAAGQLLFNVLLVAVGLGLLVLGSRLFTDAAISIARGVGISELVIGLTIVAAGTSLPEVATSITAAIRGERDIAVGNVVGSNIFNIMGVLGLASLASGRGLAVPEGAMYFELPVMIAVAIACLPVFFTGGAIARWEGGVFLAYYVAYTAYLILAEVNPAVTMTFGTIMVGFVMPLTAITLAVTVARAMRGPSY